MEILFLLTGLLCALLVPLSQLTLFGLKGVFFFFIMALFLSAVMAYMTLSIAKFLIAKLDFLRSNTIVSWNLEQKAEKKTSPLPYAVSAAAGILVGVFLRIQRVNVTSAILITLAAAFELLGWWLIAQKRVQNKLEEVPDFLLSHMGLILNGKMSVFNGYSTGITNVDVQKDTLVLTVKKHRQESAISLKIPADQTEAVQNFIADMNDYFKGENNAEE